MRHWARTRQARGLAGRGSQALSCCFWGPSRCRDLPGPPTWLRWQSRTCLRHPAEGQVASPGLRHHGCPLSPRPVSPSEPLPRHGDCSLSQTQAPSRPPRRTRVTCGLAGCPLGSGRRRPSCQDRTRPFAAPQFPAGTVRQELSPDGGVPSPQLQGVKVSVPSAPGDRHVGAAGTGGAGAEAGGTRAPEPRLVTENGSWATTDAAPRGGRGDGGVRGRGVCSGGHSPDSKPGSASPAGRAGLNP